MKTAVEYTFERIHDLIHESHQPFLADLYESMLELEKQQIVDAYQWGRTDQHSKESKWYNRNAKQYYSETYKNESEL
jgi:hypothetical protein